MPKAAFSPLGRRAQEEWPPFLGGRLRLQILMAVSVWGPMRLMEIAQLTGESAHAKSHWNKAARYLERCGILICQKKHQRHLLLGLDRRHPAHREIQWLGMAHHQLVAALYEPSRAAVRKLEGAGFIVGRERKAQMWAVERGRARIWLDVGYTMRYAEDPSDSDHELLLDVVEVLEGAEQRAWLKERIMEL